MNNFGKTLTVFLIVIALLSISLATISLFFFAKEVDVRKSLDEQLELVKVKESTLQGELKETKQRVFLLEEKNKEAEEKIESLMEDLELEEGISEEIKKENRTLKESLEVETQAKEDLRKKLEVDVDKAEEKITSLQQELKVTVERNKELDAQKQTLQTQYQKLKKQLEEMNVTPVTEVSQVEPQDMQESSGVPKDETLATQEESTDNVDLEKIVVSPRGEGKGRIITIDKESEFLIVDLGEQDGVIKDTILSIYRGDIYIGDVKVSRVLPEMAAADFVPPLTSQGVRKDDTVVIKK